MSEALALRPGRGAGADLPSRLGALVTRLAEVLDGLPSVADELPGGLPFLAAFRASLAEEALEAPDTGGLERLAGGLALDDLEVDLVLLAGLAEEHEGVASVLTAVHPSGEPRPSLGLAAQLLAPDGEARRRLAGLASAGAAVGCGLLRVEGDAPLFRRSLRTAEALWPVLRGVDAWPAAPERIEPPAAAPELAGWLGAPECARAVRALARGVRALVLVVAEDPEQGLERAAALAAAADVRLVAARLSAGIDRGGEALLGLHALARDAVPLAVFEGAEEAAGPAPRSHPLLSRHPGPVLACAAAGALAPRGGRPLLEVRADPLPAGERARVWVAALPELAAEAGRLGALYASGPTRVQEVAGDARTAAALEGRAPTARDVARAVAARATAPSAAGVTRRRPRARFDDLVLPDDRMAQLREAVARLRHQVRVIDGWGFLRGRPGAHGVRLLLSGPPGTGKSLSAEVLAGELGVDLLVVDVSRLVSKWIGETEKNLARAFDAAERSHAVLLFDEADALFARRTEVSDANARYANLETAYLLARLERFEGLAILSTNLKRNVDPAFLRRMEFSVDYLEPAAGERLALWRHHVPEGAPLAPDVDLAELASLYPLVGGLIRNAAVAAAFLAADEDSPIRYRHLVHAVRREYEKAGRAFPGYPRGVA